jgi:hypothetical protein
MRTCRICTCYAYFVARRDGGLSRPGRIVPGWVRHRPGARWAAPRFLIAARFHKDMFDPEELARLVHSRGELNFSYRGKPMNNRREEK